MFGLLLSVLLSGDANACATPHVVAVGDSITVGYWPELNKRLRGWRVDAVARGGWSSRRMLYEGGLLKAARMRPSVVVYMMGTNDLIDQKPSVVAERLARSVIFLRLAGVPRVVIGTIPPLKGDRLNTSAAVFSAAWMLGRAWWAPPDGLVGPWRTDAELLVRHRIWGKSDWDFIPFDVAPGVALWELGGRIAATQLTDGVHPGRKGYEELAERVAQAALVECRLDQPEWQ